MNDHMLSQVPRQTKLLLTYVRVHNVYFVQYDCPVFKNHFPESKKIFEVIFPMLF